MKKLVFLGLLLFPLSANAVSFCNYLEITAKGCFSGAKINSQMSCKDFVRTVKEEAKGKAPQSVINDLAALCGFACIVQRSGKVTEEKFYEKVNEVTATCDAGK